MDSFVDVIRNDIPGKNFYSDSKLNDYSVCFVRGRIDRHKPWLRTARVISPISRSCDWPTWRENSDRSLSSCSDLDTLWREGCIRRRSVRDGGKNGWQEVKGYRVLLLGQQRSNSSLSRELPSKRSKSLWLGRTPLTRHTRCLRKIFTPLPLSTHERRPFPAHHAPAGHV
jgi:hypothetical protein